MFIFKIVLGVLGLVAYTLSNIDNFSTNNDELDANLKYLRSLERLEKTNINYTKNKIKELIHS